MMQGHTILTLRLAVYVPIVLDRGWTWPILPILSILKIADTNTTKMSLSNEGAIQITLDSGLATYKYIIPAQAA